MKTISKSSFGLLTALILVFTLADVQPAGVFSNNGKPQLATMPPLLLDIQVVDAGDGRTCALTNSGGVTCWGGDNQNLTPTDVGGLESGISAISTGWAHACALTDAGGVKCWGVNYYGQLGDGTTTESQTPVNVNGMASGISSISSGRYHTCALTDAGGVKCWGLNADGQLGDGTTTDRLTPVDVSGLTNGVVAVSAGAHYTCALVSGGGIKCWGNNKSGQLGDGTMIERHTPVDVSGMTSGISAVSTGSNHTCALTTGGAVKCWGWNRNGQLGNGQNTPSSIPVNVSGMASGMKAVQVGETHTCALSTGGMAKCWGENKFAQLGDGTLTDRNQPVAVIGLSSGVKKISADYRHTCVIISSGGVKCWGWNPYGQLGDGTIIKRTAPVNVLQLEKTTYRSAAELDGFIRESSENSNVGGSVNSSDDYLLVGDDDLDRQMIAILSFNTSSLPDTAVIYSAPLQIRWLGTGGISGWAKIKVDIRKPYFGSSVFLFVDDFQAASSRSAVGTFPTSGTPFLTNAAFPFINPTGTTQLRIRYATDDNDNSIADFTRYASGNAIPSYRPQLIVYYYVP